MIIIKIIIILAILTGSVLAEIKVVTSTSDLAYFVREIGKEKVEVEAIAPPDADVHFVEVRPSHMIKVARAEILFKVGLELDMWMDKIVDGSRNSRLVIVDCSKYIRPVEVPAFKADARYGDLHRFGNPHYWLGPQNVPAITDVIVEGLSRLAPGEESYFRANQKQLLENIETGVAAIRDKLDKLKGREVIFYHNSWPYFNEFSGLVAAGFIEPYPGVPPTPTHIKELIDLVTQSDIRVIAIEPYFDRRVPDKIASASKAQVVILHPSIGGRQANESYLDWLKGNVNALWEDLP